MSKDGNPYERLALETGDQLSYLGKKRILTVIRDDRKSAKVKGVSDRIILWVPYNADYVMKREQLEKWYRKEALLVFTKKASAYAEILSVSFNEIRIKDQRSCWGSCSGRKNLNFNWRILMAPEPVCDYIILHEVCHLIHMDHSPAFWELVAHYCPDYAKHKKWLKDYTEQLYLF